MAENPTLALDPDEMRRIGYRVIDMLVEHSRNLPDKDVSHNARLDDLRRALREPVPESGSNVEDLLQRASEHVFRHISHVDHPRFFGFIPSPSNFVSVLADTLASGFNVFSGSWISGAGAAVVEEVTIDWIRQLCGFPDSAGGLFVSGGSMANLTALAVARRVHLADRFDDAVVYSSDQSHSAVDRALRILGFRPDQLRKIPADSDYRMDVGALTEAIGEDRANGQRPFCVVGTAGTTNTGSIDPLSRLSELCRRESLWLHVDGAYGAAAVISERGRTALSGLEEVDSLALDPHKWLFQPYELGCVLVKSQQWLTDTFQILPEYLDDTRRETEAINYCDYGMQLTRSFRALKLWMSLKAFGLESFRSAVERSFELAELAQSEIEQMEGWQIVTRAQMGIVTFRYAGAPQDALDDLNRKIAERLGRDGFAFVSTTRLKHRTVLRFCTINPRTSEEDLRKTVRRLDEIAHTLTD